MRREQVIDLGNGLSVRVTEITVGQYRNLLRRAGGVSFDVGRFLRGEEEIPTEVLALFTDLSPERIPAMTFSEIRQVLDGIKEVNADFFGVHQTLGVAAGVLAAMSEANSTAPSGSSSSGAM